MLDDVEHLMLHRATADMISVALAEKYGKPGPDGVKQPVPIETIRDYMARARARWASDPHKDDSRAELKARQLRRLYRRLSALKGHGNFREAIETERLIAKIEGNEAPRVLGFETPPGGGSPPIAAQSIPQIVAALKKLSGEE